MSTTISIFRDDMWAGDGRLEGGSIVDCPAILGRDQDDAEDCYEAIEDAIESGDDSVIRDDGIYTWVIKS